MSTTEHHPGPPAAVVTPPPPWHTQEADAVVTALSSDLRELVKSLERRHQALEEAASQADAELRDHLVRQSATQSAELARTAERLSNQLDQVSSKLQSEKLDTTALAAGFTDFVSRLTSNGYNAAKPKSKD